MKSSRALIDAAPQPDGTHRLLGPQNQDVETDSEAGNTSEELSWPRQTDA